MKISRFTCALATVLALVSICYAAPAPPINMQQYERQPGRHGYPPLVISQHNLQRVLDDQLPADQRVASFRVIIAVGGQTNETMAALMNLMSAPDTPAALKDALLTSSLNVPTTGGAGGMEFVITALNTTNLSPAMEAELLAWIDTNGDDEMLADVIKQWAAQPANGPGEGRFRMVVERIGGAAWDQVLFSGLGSRVFYARGSAQVVLATRLSAADYRSKLLAVRPSHESIAALQTFIKGFDFIPRTKAEMLSTVTLYVKERQSINAAALLYARWRDTADYSFRVRDYHLLAALAKDTPTMETSRDAVIAELAQTLTARPHAPHYFGGTSEAVYDARFRSVAGRLSMMDLWNIKLLSELLARREIQAGLKVLADRDRIDTSSAWGGLMFFERGRATAKQYPPAEVDPPNDLVYAPTKRMLNDSHNSMCRFVTHFERTDNARRAGPTPAELADARANDFYGMTITRLDEGTFTANYYTPEGQVVSLGTFNFTSPAAR